jgi:hypothetical protein
MSRLLQLMQQQLPAVREKNIFHKYEIYFWQLGLST